MPAKKKTDDQNLFGDGELSQELIDQMLNGGGGAAADPVADPWADGALQAEIDAARTEAGLPLEESVAAVPVGFASAPAPSPMPIQPRSAPAAAPTAVHPVQFMPLTPEPPALNQAHGIEL